MPLASDKYRNEFEWLNEENWNSEDQ